MALLNPFPHTRGPGFISKPLDTRQPAMYANTTTKQAWWSWFSGAKFYPHFHPAIDMVAPEGTPIYAPEAGVVVRAGWLSNSSGYGVNVDIKPGSRYVFGHMSSVAVKVGQRVARGGLLGRVGHTGAASGPHSHHGIQLGSRLYDPLLFYPGGSMANDARIKPGTSVRYAVLKGGGINIRNTPDLDVGSTNIYATSRDSADNSKDGIFRNGTYMGPLTYKFIYQGDVSTDDGVFIKCYGLNKTLYIYKSLVNIS